LGVALADVVITYETLFDLLRKEKGRQELQQLPVNFYGQVVAYLRQKQKDVDAAGGASSAGAQKALVQFRNVQKILRELHERRERKIIEMALNRARAESNIVDTEPLLREEQEFYTQCAELFLAHKERLLLAVLNGDAPDGTVVPALSAPLPDAHSGRTPGDDQDMGNETPSHSSRLSPEEVASQESCSVVFVAAVPKFLGLKGEVHGPFSPGDTAELPGKIVAVLLKKKRAELA